MNVVVVPKEICWNFPSSTELAVFSNYGLDFFDKCVFRVVTRNFEGSSRLFHLKQLALLAP